MRRLLLLSGLALAACSQEASKPAPPTPATEPAPQALAAQPVSQATAKTARVRLGDPVAASTVPLADVAKSSHSFEGRSIATGGTVTAVCQSMGCWMEITDAASNAHIRMHGHSFFIPKDASGRHARVQATVLPVGEGTECNKEAAEQMGHPVAKVELDATGVELD